MFTRIVKMEFKPEQVPPFLANFESVKEKIRRFPGCKFLELYGDKQDATRFFTYSKWESESDLEAYRTSELFIEVWTTTKPMFRSKAQAWSVDTLHSLT
ncbi:MAG: antibiotic biosynthesis monooxygenase [Altibacter sp.]|uniref:putative quinol monooxygenase n=1 Tax=Altibacter sp. TaxID=2024823 RepID=UPI001E13F678|nr:antibiotic biosynthesis monooxygenase family protein [Altibacter sp.]MBZ0326085.1 antibiotic biosynthesis monooxygenase [Altibacter sp.]